MLAAPDIEILPAIVVHAREARRPLSLVIVFGATLCLSAFLMFLIEPMVAKMVLPIFGGSPMVWNTCVAFFQITLLAGYAYAHTISSMGRPARIARRSTCRRAAAVLRAPIWPPRRLDARSDTGTRAVDPDLAGRQLSACHFSCWR